eukprot:gene29607-26234_t
MSAMTLMLRSSPGLLRPATAKVSAAAAPPPQGGRHDSKVGGESDPQA